MRRVQSQDSSPSDGVHVVGLPGRGDEQSRMYLPVGCRLPDCKSYGGFNIPPIPANPCVIRPVTSLILGEEWGDPRCTIVRVRCVTPPPIEILLDVSTDLEEATIPFAASTPQRHVAGAAQGCDVAAEASAAAAGQAGAAITDVRKRPASDGLSDDMEARVPSPGTPPGDMLVVTVSEEEQNFFARSPCHRCNSGE